MVSVLPIQFRMVIQLESRLKWNGARMYATVYRYPSTCSSPKFMNIKCECSAQDWETLVVHSERRKLHLLSNIEIITPIFSTDDRDKYVNTLMAFTFARCHWRNHWMIWQLSILNVLLSTRIITTFVFSLAKAQSFMHGFRFQMPKANYIIAFHHKSITN